MDNFPLASLLASDTAARLGIDNSPDPLSLQHIEEVLKPNLEKLRALLGNHPVIVTSGYRSPALNAHIPGSSNTSAHTLGYAADVVIPGYGSPWHVCNRIAMLTEDELQWDQVIYEYGSWTHISFDPRGRRMLLTKFSGQPYREGLYQV